MDQISILEDRSFVLEVLNLRVGGGGPVTHKGKEHHTAPELEPVRFTAEDPKWIIFFKATGFSKGFRGLALPSTVSSALAPLPSLLQKRLRGSSSHVGCKRHVPEFMRVSLMRRRFGRPEPKGRREWQASLLTSYIPSHLALHSPVARSSPAKPQAAAGTRSETTAGTPRLSSPLPVDITKSPASLYSLRGSR